MTTTERPHDSCREIFVEKVSMMKTYISAILIVLGMTGGVIAWAMRIESTLAVHEETLEQCKIEVNELSLLRGTLTEIIENQKQILANTAKPRAR